MKVKRGRVTPKREVCLTMVGDGRGPWFVVNGRTGEARSWCALCGDMMPLDEEHGPFEQVCAVCLVIDAQEV